MLLKKTKSAQRQEIRRLLPRKKLHAHAASRHEEIEEYEGESEPSMKLSQAFLVVLVLHVVAVGGIYGFSKFKEHTTPKVAAKTEASPTTPKKEATETIKAPVAAQEAKSNAAAQTYTVMAGDTLKRIATKYNTSIESIEKANNLAPNTVLRVGQVLTIKTTTKPVTEPVKPNPVTTTDKSAPAPAVVAKAPPVKAPEAEKTLTPKVPAKTDAATETAKDTAYVVEKGDTPYSIAKKLKVSEAALMKANNIDDPRKLKIGMKLTLP